ncbi:hypothetical protein HK097_003602, partial [Rhizophlyctis rosea]
MEHLGNDDDWDADASFDSEETAMRRKKKPVSTGRPWSSGWVTGNDMREALSSPTTYLFAVLSFTIFTSLDVTFITGRLLAIEVITSTTASDSQHNPYILFATPLTILPHILAFVLALLLAPQSDRTLSRTLPITLLSIISCIGFIITAWESFEVPIVRYTLGYIPATTAIISTLPFSLSYLLDRVDTLSTEGAKTVTIGLAMGSGQGFGILCKIGLETQKPITTAPLLTLAIVFTLLTPLITFSLHYTSKRESRRTWDGGPAHTRLLNDIPPSSSISSRKNQTIEDNDWDIDLETESTQNFSSPPSPPPPQQKSLPSKIVTKPATSTPDTPRRT